MLTLEQIYKEHKNTVYNLALHYTQNAEDAKEITQDVFVAVHFGLSDFRSNSKLSTWIYRIAINKSLDYLKMKRRKKRITQFTTLFGAAQNETALVHFNHPGVELEQKEEVAHIFAIINALPENQRTVVILMKIEGRTQNETAEIMAMTGKAVESLYQRAKQNIQNKLTTKN